jgi:GNAT superfamily N-acetyltransferase
VIDLTPEQIARCRELSLGDEGYMCETLDLIFKTEDRWHYRYSQAVILSIMDNIVGWALLQPVPYSRRYNMHLFVDESQRRQGFGTLLLKEANRWCKAPVAMVDRENQDFFHSHTDLYTELEYA